LKNSDFFHLWFFTAFDKFVMVFIGLDKNIPGNYGLLFIYLTTITMVISFL